MTTGDSHIVSNRQHRLSDQVLANTPPSRVRSRSLAAPTSGRGRGIGPNRRRKRRRRGPANSGGRGYLPRPRSAWREANRGHVSLDQLMVMSAIERCRTAALGGHVARCENDACAHTAIAYNSCRNRHCPKCQGAAARRWLAEREAELLPVEYFHVGYTLPAELRDIAYQ